MNNQAHVPEGGNKAKGKPKQGRLAPWARGAMAGLALSAFFSCKILSPERSQWQAEKDSIEVLRPKMENDELGLMNRLLRQEAADFRAQADMVYGLVYAFENGKRGHVELVDPERVRMLAARVSESEDSDLVRLQAFGNAALEIYGLYETRVLRPADWDREMPPLSDSMMARLNHLKGEWGSSTARRMLRMGRKEGVLTYLLARAGHWEALDGAMVDSAQAWLQGSNLMEGDDWRVMGWLEGVGARLEGEKGRTQKEEQPIPIELDESDESGIGQR